MISRILIAEDEPLLAIAMSDQLREHGFEVVGVAATVSQALGLIDREHCDAAILDCNLRGASVEPIADCLRERQIPFLIHSGYNNNNVPAKFADAPFLSKPVGVATLMAALEMITKSAK